MAEPASAVESFKFDTSTGMRPHYLIPLFQKSSRTRIARRFERSSRQFQLFRRS